MSNRFSGAFFSYDRKEEVQKREVHSSRKGMDQARFHPKKGFIIEYDPRGQFGTIFVSEGEKRCTFPCNARKSVMIKRGKGGKPYLSNELRKKVKSSVGQKVVVTEGFLNGDSQPSALWAPLEIWTSCGGQ